MSLPARKSKAQPTNSCNGNVEDRLVHAYVEFLKFRIPRPQLDAVQSSLNVMRRAGVLTKGHQQKILPIIGPTGSGKSTIITDWCDGITAKEGLPDGVHPIVNVRRRVHQDRGRRRSVGSQAVSRCRRGAVPVLSPGQDQRA